MSTRELKNITVIGGGTAGWLTALYVKTVLPTKTVTLIESPDIKILGAGEGSTPPLISLLDVLEIPVSKFVRETGSTIKNGVKFTNWRNGGEKDHYFHSFAARGNLDMISSFSIERFVAGCPIIYPIAVAQGDKQEDYDFGARVSSQNKLAYRYRKNETFSIEDPIFQFEQMGAFSIHFDAHKLAKILKDIAQERGIIHIEGEVVDYLEDERGEVRQLTLAHGAGIDTNFVFDCTGFKSFFAKKLNAKWVSHKDSLTVNSAVPFFLDMEKPIPPYTEAIAMKYGWVWKIPLQERYGCGYVYDSNHISDEEAKQEIEEWLGYEPEWVRKEPFRFEAGYLENPWQKNVICAGLTAGFFEPLEATSIWVTISLLSRVLANVENLYKYDERIAEDYNRHSISTQEEVAAFIYLHYMTGRTDTPFWKHYTKENAPKHLHRYLDIVEYRTFMFEDIDPNDKFPLQSWYSIMLGIGNEKFIENLKLFEFYNFTRSYIKNQYHFHKKTVETVAEFEAVSHDEFLEKLKEDLT